MNTTACSFGIGINRVPLKINNCKPTKVGSLKGAATIVKRAKKHNEENGAQGTAGKIAKEVNARTKPLFTTFLPKWCASSPTKLETYINNN